MKLKPEDIEEFKRIHLKHTGEVLTDAQAIDLNTRLLNLFETLLKPVDSNVNKLQTFDDESYLIQKKK